MSHMVKQLTLCVIHTDTHILLGMKKRGFGVGRWNGFGGKVEMGESLEESARRELFEETGLEAESLVPRGMLRFEYATKPDVLEVSLFGVSGCRGEAVETDEMRPRWFRLIDIPFDQMWPDDRHWLPRFLEGAHLDGKFYLLDDDTLLDHDVKSLVAELSL